MLVRQVGHVTIDMQFNSLLDTSERDAVFQQDIASLHMSTLTIAVLQLFFEDSLISAGLWPPCSSDLNPLDVCKLGMLKDTVYMTVHATLEDLKQLVSKELSKFTLAICKKIFGNLVNIVKFVKRQTAVIFNTCCESKCCK